MEVAVRVAPKGTASRCPVSRLPSDSGREFTVQGRRLKSIQMHHTICFTRSLTAVSTVNLKQKVGLLVVFFFLVFFVFFGSSKGDCWLQCNVAPVMMRSGCGPDGIPGPL